jgi:hypothetical protein
VTVPAPAAAAPGEPVIAGCYECMARLIPGHELPSVAGRIGPPVEGFTAAEAADRAAGAGFVVVPGTLRDPAEVILVLACPHAAEDSGRPAARPE